MAQTAAEELLELLQQHRDKRMTPIWEEEPVAPETEVSPEDSQTD